MKHTWKQTGKRAGAAALSALMLGGVVIPASAAVDPVVDEAFYGTLDYYGGLTEGSVVKSYRTNGNARIFDVGRYDEVINLTDRTEPIVSGDKVTFELGESAPKNFYFEGKTAEPYRDMPFRVELSYRMNGVETDPENMAGQKGVGEVLLDVYPNERASEYARNNFVMEAMAILKDTDILSVEADGAQVQKIGNLVMVLYMVLPGEEQHFTLRIGADEFSFGGFTFLIQPATLAQLSMIDDLREAKEEMEDSYEAITDSLDAILDSLDGMGSTLLDTADGLDQLNEARATLSAGKNRVYDEADRALDAMTEVSDSLAPVVDHLKTAKDALAETTDQATALSDAVQTLRPDLKGLKDSLADVQNDLTDINALLGDAREDAGKLSKKLHALEEDLDDLRDDLNDVSDEMGDLRSAIGKVDDIESIDGITIRKNGKTYTVQEIRDAHTQAEGIYQVCAGVAAATGGKAPADEEAFMQFVMGEDTRPYVIHYLADAKAKEAVKDYEGTPYYDGAYEKAYAQAKTACDQQLDRETVETLAYLYYNWTDGDNVKSQLADADTFNSMIDEANSAIEKANQTLADLKKPTQNLLGSLQTLLDNGSDGLLPDSQETLKILRSLTDTAAEYDPDDLHSHVTALLGTTRNLLTTTDTALEKSKSLADTMNKYEPEAEKALDDAVKQVNASVKLLDDLNGFTTTFENLMKAADPDLDEGSKKSLAGLAGVLRQSKKTLDSTDTIRQANSTIEGLVEDKWEAYTGEENNALNMDADAEMVSLTSEENKTPNSIQLVLRTQEIKVDEEAKAKAEAENHPKTTFWERVLRMCRDFAAIFTGD